MVFVLLFESLELLLPRPLFPFLLVTCGVVDESCVLSAACESALENCPGVGDEITGAFTGTVFTAT